MTLRERMKRDQIREGAQRVFLERGFERASTDAIAAEAGVSKQTLYAYYPGKEELLADVLRQLVIEGPQAPMALLEGPEPRSREELREALTEAAHRAVGTMMSPDYLALLRVIIAEVPRRPELGDVFRSTVPERGLAMLSGLLERADERGIARVPDADAAARMLIGSLVTYALLDGLLNAEGPVRPPGPERIRALIQLYMKAIS
jgi:TetR/AcrR family transcriptional regulator, mexJK operon transcriptional repressor